MAAKLGPAVWRLLFSLVSIVGLALIFYGYGQARSAPIILYVSPLWLRDTVVMLMAFVFPLVFAAYFPGLIKTIFKHPMLVAVKLWAFMHLLVNGSLADVLLFGSVLAWAVADRISLKRRPVRTDPHRAARQMERCDRSHARLRRLHRARRGRASVAHGHADRVRALDEQPRGRSARRLRELLLDPRRPCRPRRQLVEAEQPDAEGLDSRRARRTAAARRRRSAGRPGEACADWMSASSV